MRLIILLIAILISSISAQINEKELWQLYIQKKYSEVYQKTDTFLRDNPNHPSMNLLKGRALVDQGKFIEGKRYIENAVLYDINNSWIKAWGLHYLGMIEFSNGNTSKAKDHFQNCILMNATNNVNKATKVLMTILGLVDYYNNWQIIETDNFIFFFQPNTVVSDINQFTESRENAYHKINNYFNCKIPKKISFFVWNGNDDAKSIGIPQLGFSRPKFCVIHSRSNQTKGHEIAHIVSHYLYDLPIKSRFINEGIAVAFDLTKENKLDSALLMKKNEEYEKQISIIDAWNNGQKYPEWVYYQLAGEFIKRLIDNGGNDKFLKLVSNQTYDNAKIIYGDLLKEIINDLENEIN